MLDVINNMVGSDCLEGWKADLETAVNDLKKSEAETLKAETTYANATQWEAKLRGWQDSLEQTAELTVMLEAELSIFKTHIGLVSKSTDSIVQAIEILYCQVKKVFYDPDSTGTPCVENISHAIRGLQEAVYCLGNPPNLNKNGGFLKKVSELEAKLKAVEDVREDILKKLIALVQSINLMETAICDGDGLQGIITMLHCEFSGGDTSDESNNSLEPLSMPTNCGCHSADETEHSCDSSLTPIIKFPLLENDDFVKSVIQKHSASMSEKDSAATDYSQKRQKRDRLLARKNGLEKAILAATAAKK
jgi:hypothetical protein